MRNIVTSLIVFFALLAGSNSMFAQGFWNSKPKKPKTPYSPKPGPKKNPKAEDEVADIDMPNWLSFDELGLNFED